MKKLKFIVILLVVLSSNTAFFGLIYAKQTFILLMASVFILFLKNKTIDKKNFKIFISCIILLLSNSLLNSEYLSASGFIWSYGIIMVKCFIMFIVVCNMSKDEIVNNYINIMSIISVISIICFTIEILLPESSYLFFKRYTYSSAVFLASPFYTWGWDQLFLRNAGPFWEPGAFQGFLNVALLMLLNKKNINIKKKAILILLFVVTLLTTGSTTGYIIMSVILLLMLTQYLNYSASKKKVRYRIIGITFIFFCGYFIISSNNISNKVNNDSIGSSYSIRNKDIQYSMKIITQRPLVGYGIGTTESLIQEKKSDIYNNSCGLLLLGYTLGAPILILYSIRYYRSILKIFNNLNAVTVFGLFLILFLSEGLTYLPFYLMFLYEWKQEIYNLRGYNYEKNLGNNHIVA